VKPHTTTSTRLTGKANRILGMLNRPLAYKPKDMLGPLYESVVRLLLEHSHCTPACHLIIKERHEHQLISGLKLKSYTGLLRQLNFRSLEERRKRANLIEIFRICYK